MLQQHRFLYGKEEQVIGVFLALLYVGARYLIGGDSIEPIFLDATSFLYWWYIVTSAIIMVLVAMVALGITLTGTVAGASAGRFLGGAVGLLAGGSLAALVAARVLVVRGSLVAGAYFLHDSLSQDNSAWTWNLTSVIIGGALLLFGLWLGRSSRRTSSTNN